MQSTAHAWRQLSTAQHSTGAGQHSTAQHRGGTALIVAGWLVWLGGRPGAQVEVVKWESEMHTIALPDGLEAGAIIDIFDQWQAGGGGGGGRRRQAEAGGREAGWGKDKQGGAGGGAPAGREPGRRSEQPARQALAPNWLAGSPSARYSPQDNSHPAKVLSRSAFSKVILTRRSAPPGGGRVLHMKPTINEAIVRFQVW